MADEGFKYYDYYPPVRGDMLGQYSEHKFSLGPAYKRDDTDSIETIRYRVMGQSEKNAQALVDAWDKLYNVVQLAGQKLQTFSNNVAGTGAKHASGGTWNSEGASL